MRLWLTLVLWLGSSLVITEESPPPSKRHKCPDAAPSKHLLCYHEGKISPAELDPCICTHVVLPAIETPKGFQLDGEKVRSSALYGLRERNPSLRLLLGVDATTRTLYGASDKKVSDFVHQTADYIKSTNLDGLEVDLGEVNDDTSHTRRKENVLSVFKGLREKMGDAKPTESEGGNDSILLIRLPVRPESLAKTYDLKPLSKYVDYFTVSTHNITDSSEKDVTYHHSRLMGLADILNTDSVLDMLTGLGAPPSKMIISLPTHALRFSLKNENENVVRSPVSGAPEVINYEQVCAMMKKGGWTIERDEDLTAPYAFRNKTWIAFDDETSVTIKGKYALLRGLAGVAISSIDADDHTGECSKGYFPLTRVLRETLTTLSRKPRGVILRSLEEELRGGVAVALPEASLDASVRLSPFRIVRIVDREGAVHVIRRNSETRFECSRQGYFRHPLGCNQFYRCVKFDQLINDFSVFEYDCPPGLAFDEKWEVCVWPGQMSVPCDGSSEIAPVPRAKFTCPAEGYYADPENCRWFFACLDHHGDPNVAGRDATDPHSGLTAYEFRCPFGLAFDGSRLACEWPWTVPGCGRVEIGSGVLAAIQPDSVGYSVIGTGGVVGAGGAIHHLETGSIGSILGVGEARGVHITTGGARIHHVSGIESGSVASVFGAGDAGYNTKGAQIRLDGSRLGSFGAQFNLGGAQLGTGRATVITEGVGLVTGGANLVSGGAGLVTEGAGLVTQGEQLVSQGGGLLTGGGLVSGGAGVLSGGAELASGGANFASSGAQLLSQGIQLASGAAQLVSGGANADSGVAHIQPISRVESGSVASIFGTRDSHGAHLVTGGEQLSLGGISDLGDIASGGVRTTFISSGKDRASSGAASNSHFFSEEGRSSIVSSGGAEIASGVAQTLSGGEKIVNTYSYRAPVIKYETSPVSAGVPLTVGQSAPIGGVSFTSGSSIVTGARAGPRVQPIETVGLIGVTGIGVNGVGHNGVHEGIQLTGVGRDEVGGVEISGAGVSGVRVNEVSRTNIGLQAIPSVTPSLVSVIRERPVATVVTPRYEDVSNYSVSYSTPSTTSRPVTLVKTNIYSTPAPIQYQPPQPAFIAHETYESSAPATGSGISSFSISTDSNSRRAQDGSRASIAQQPTGPTVLNTASGRSSYSFGQQPSHQSGSYEPQFYYSSTGPSGSLSYTIDSSVPRTGAFVPVKRPSGSLSYSIDSSVPRTGAFVPVKPSLGPLSYSIDSNVHRTGDFVSVKPPSGSLSYAIDSSVPRTGDFVSVKPLVSSTIYTASERPVVNDASIAAVEAARAAAAANAEGSSVGAALSQEHIYSSDAGAIVSGTQSGFGFELVRDDGHAITGDSSSRSNLGGIQTVHQESINPVVTAPAAEFSYRDLPVSVYNSAAPSRPLEESRGGSIFQQRLLAKTYVSPAPAVKLASDTYHQNAFISQSTTPNYDDSNVGIGEIVENRGFSYKNILPVVELSTPAPQIVKVPQLTIRNQGNPNRRKFQPVFTTTAAPLPAINLEDNDYGSRITYTDTGKQPVAFSSSRGASGLLQLVQTDSPPISYSPVVVNTSPVQQIETIPVTPAPASFVSATPAPTFPSVTYSTTPSTPIPPASPVFYVPSRGSARQRYFSTTTSAPILANGFSDEQEIVQDVGFFEPNRVVQNIPVTSTYSPPVVTSVLTSVPVLNGTSYEGRRIPAYRQPILQRHGGTSSGDSDIEGPSPVSVSANVKASYGDRPSKRIRVDVLLKENDDEPQVQIETDSGKTSRGRYRYRARGGRVRVNGKKKCDDDEDEPINSDPNVDAILDGYSGSYGSVLSNGEKETFIQGIISDDLRAKSIGAEVSSSGNDYNEGYRSSQRANNPELSIGVTVKSALENSDIGRTRSRSRGRYQNENRNYVSNFKSSTIGSRDFTSGAINDYIVSTTPVAVPIVTSTVGYSNEENLGVDFGNVPLQQGINTKFSEGLIESSLNSRNSGRISVGRQRAGVRIGGSKTSNGISEIISETSRKRTESAFGDDNSALDINHAAVIILPCGKLPALLAKLGAVTEGLKSIEQDSSSTSLKITEERARTSLALPPLQRYGPGDWNAIEKSLGNDACKRAGLFRHPQDCNRFYECYWDESKGKYSLHEFKCPIRLAYDDSLSACNWPTSGPACSANKLLV